MQELEVEGSENPLEFKKTAVTGGWLPPGYCLDAFTNVKDPTAQPLIPYFTLQSGLQLARAMPNLHFDADEDAFVARNRRGRDAAAYEAVTVAIEGTECKLYPIGAPGWGWRVAGT